MLWLLSGGNTHFDSAYKSSYHTKPHTIIAKKTTTTPQFPSVNAMMFPSPKQPFSKGVILTNI